MILCPRSQRDTRYATFLLATGHKGNRDLTDMGIDAARRTVSQQVAAFKRQWVELFGIGLYVPQDKDWYETWVDYSHWLESERLWQMMLEGLPNEIV